MDIGNREETPATRPVTLRLERKHLLAIRWMHWINFPLLFIMILSGIRIYWNDSDKCASASTCCLSHWVRFAHARTDFP